ncbi:hypothetical protein C6P74_06420 [Burkholderia multivorans]|nr:hypothetical protein C6P74_06420 [Burkholderia multivorans]
MAGAGLPSPGSQAAAQCRSAAPIRDNDLVRSASPPPAHCCGALAFRARADRRGCRDRAASLGARCSVLGARCSVLGARAEAEARFVDESRRQPRYRRERKKCDQET